MITNERQYAIAQAELRRFEKAAAGQQGQAPAAGIDPHIGEAMVDSLRCQAETLRKEVKRYEDLRDGRIGQRELESLRDFPTALIEARIVAGLTQEQLGERLEVEGRQIQRWEANLYTGVGVERLHEVAGALGMEVKASVNYAATRITSSTRLRLSWTKRCKTPLFLHRVLGLCLDKKGQNAPFQPHSCLEPPTTASPRSPASATAT